MGERDATGERQRLPCQAREVKDVLRLCTTTHSLRIELPGSEGAVPAARRNNFKLELAATTEPREYAIWGCVYRGKHVIVVLFRV